MKKTFNEEEVKELRLSATHWTDIQLIEHIQELYRRIEALEIKTTGMY